MWVRAIPRLPPNFCLELGEDGFEEQLAGFLLADLGKDRIQFAVKKFRFNHKY